jgi:hypothetical protein
MNSTIPLLVLMMLTAVCGLVILSWYLCIMWVLTTDHKYYLLQQQGKC